MHRMERTAIPRCKPAPTTRLGIVSFGPALLGIGILIASIALLSYSRPYFGFGTETDFLGSFLGEAQAFLHGQPIDARYHPPFYSICIALLHLVCGDWFTTGRLLSLVSAAVVALTSFWLYRNSVSAAAGYGTILALAVSPIFVEYAALATTDMFFLALYSSALVLARESDRHASAGLWVATGVIIALALLTRTNGITLALLLAVPLLARALPWRHRCRHLGCLGLGMLTPLVLWAVLALVTQSTLWPNSGTATNLALTYFPPNSGTTWADGLRYAQSQFPTLGAVFAYDPGVLFARYQHHLYHAFEHLLAADGLFAFPANALILPTLIFFVVARQATWVYYVAVLALAQLLVVNFMSYQARFHLFLIPLTGALMAEFMRQLLWNPYDPAAPGLLRHAGRAIAAALLGLALLQADRLAIAGIDRGQPELVESIPAAAKIIPRNALLIARKPVISYYTHTQWIFMPAGKNLDDLLATIAQIQASGEQRHLPIYLYYGQEERHLRPEYQRLMAPQRIDGSATGLVPVAQAPGPETDWVLYRYRGSP